MEQIDYIINVFIAVL